MANNEDAPFGLFRSLYTLFTIGSTLMMAALLVWLLVVLFTTTSPGTADSQETEAMRPQLTALAEEYAGEAAGFSEEAANAGVAVEIFNGNGCNGCHTLEGVSQAVVCPDLTGLGASASERLAEPSYTGDATSAEAYMRESIREPAAFLVEGYGPLMPAFTESQIDDDDLDVLVEYLLSR